MPSLFVAHGSPMLAVEENAYTNLLGELGKAWRPKAILLFSAHWESDTQMVSTVGEYRTIYDFGGFPEALYRIQYPARGDAALAQEVGRLLGEQGISYRFDSQRGLDHGAWVPLRRIYPDAGVPVISMSVDAALRPQEQYAIGKALAGLRAQDVMVIGSGVTVHNFGTIRFRAPGNEADAWAVEFDDWVLSRAAAWDLDSLFDYEERAPHARLAVPPQGNEHFVPLFYAMGAADDQRSCKELHRSYQYGNLSHVVWQFGG
ncbi:MAG TPA: class III extradiol ring-cleavage dioxygenase [Symbiobacteriaceae bacterium]|nr:class III extradiol ring-cleavage dioxygenase [Symbiobacteriaceae bacterium]